MTGGGGDGGVYTDDKQGTGHHQHDSEDPPMNNITIPATSQPDTSRKRAGSPINEYQYDGLTSEIRPLKRINTDNPPYDEGHNSGTLLLLGGDSGALAPPDHNLGRTTTTSSLSPAFTSYSSSSTLPCDFTHLATVVDKRDGEDGVECPAPRLDGEGEPSSSIISNDPGNLGPFEHQASIYPTPQTGEFVEQAAFELPPLRPKAFQGDEQATQVTLPHFNEIYGSIDTSLPQTGPAQPTLSVFNAPTFAHSVQPVYSQHEDAHRHHEQDIPVLLPVDGTAKDHFQQQEQQYQQQLPLPHQPFLPTPDRMDAIRAQQLRYQQQQDDEYMARHQLYQQSAESQYSQAYQAFLEGQCLPPAVVEQRPADPYIMHEVQPTRRNDIPRPFVVGYPQDSFRRPCIVPDHYPHSYESVASSSAGHTYGLGITNMARPPSKPQQSYGHEQTQPALGRPPSASFPQPSAPNFGAPDCRAFYENEQHKMHLQNQRQQQQHQLQASSSSASEAVNAFRPARFPPETYTTANNSQQRESVTHIHNQGAGATLAKAPSFTSPPLHHREGPPRLPFTPSMIPSKLHNPYAAFSPGGRPQISVAQQIVDRIDLPTLHHALRYWKSILSDPKTHPDLRTTSAMNCHVLEKRIKVVTSAMQEQQARIFGGAPPAIGTGVVPTASAAIESPSRPMTAPPRPEYSAARARTHSSDDMINTTPMPAVPSLLMRRTASSSVSSTTSPVRSKVTTPKPTATPKGTIATPAEADSHGDNPKISARLTLSDMASKASSSRSKSTVATRKSAATSAAATAPTKRGRKPESANTKADKGKSPANASGLNTAGGSSAMPILTSTGVAGPTDIAVPVENAIGAAASPQEPAAGTNNKQVAKANSSGKKKSESPAPAAATDAVAHKPGDLIFENEWPKDDSHSSPLKVVLGPQLLSDVTYTWSQQECAKERRLMHVTATMNLQERSIVIKVEPLAPQSYSVDLDAAPYVQGAVVSCIFAEIFSKEPGEEPPIYWISYWDVLKVCEVSLDLPHRTLHFRRGQDLKGRIRAVLDKLGWVDVRKLGSPAGIALSTKMTKYPTPRPLENPRLNLKIMPWNQLHHALEALAQRLARANRLHFSMNGS